MHISGMTHLILTLRYAKIRVLATLLMGKKKKIRFKFTFGFFILKKLSFNISIFKI